jgi:serine/threonine-protein kinase
VQGKYLIEAVLGSGGMATVYAARHRNKKRVALKMLHAELSGHADVRARFLREGYVANTVDHPGAVAVLDEDVAEDGSAFLVMEFLDGASLESLTEARGVLALDCVLTAAHETLGVLVAAHAKQVVHRDIKPANLFLTRDGRVKVLDYGIARLREANASSTRTGTSMGTPAFMAPEQAAGKASLVDEQSDLWSLGATMFTLLTGRFVHEGETPQHMMVLAATQAPASVASSSPELPTLAGALLDRALAFDKASRWGSAALMRDAVADVHTALFGHPPTSAPLVDLASRAVPLSFRSANHIVDTNRLGDPVTPPITPVPALSTGKPLDVTVLATTHGSAAPKRFVPLSIGGVVVLAIVSVLLVRYRPEAPRSGLTPAPDAKAVVSSSPDMAVSAAPPPTGAVDPAPTAAPSPVPLPSLSASVAPLPHPSSRPPAARHPHPAAAAPSAATIAPNDFDRQ